LYALLNILTGASAPLDKINPEQFPLCLLTYTSLFIASNNLLVSHPHRLSVLHCCLNCLFAILLMLSVSYNSKSFSNFSKTLSREVKIPIFSFRKKKEERTKFGVYNLRELQTEQTLARILVLNLLCKRNMRNLSFYLTNLTNFLNFLFPFLIKIPSKSLPVQIETMVSLVSRTGRNLQRYEKGCRLVVGWVSFSFLFSPFLFNIFRFWVIC